MSVCAHPLMIGIKDPFVLSQVFILRQAQYERIYIR
jgi:hypothetical protein